VVVFGGAIKTLVRNTQRDVTQDCESSFNDNDVEASNQLYNFEGRVSESESTTL